MYTQCPECDTIFRVNAAVLRAAQGQVRCGVCEATFDAIRFLTDEIEAGVNAASASRIHFEAPPDEHSMGDIGSDGTEHAPSPFRPSPSLPLVAFEMAEASNEWWATPVAEWSAADSGEAALDRTTAHPEEAVSAAPAPDDGGESANGSDAADPMVEAVDDPEEEPSWTPSAETIAAFEPLATPVIEIDERDRAGHNHRRTQRASLGPWLACGALLLGLLGQYVDHERERLVTLPALAPALTAVYTAIGRPLEPRWDLGAYDIREWTATPDADSHTIRLRAKIRNRGAQAQPWPLLRVVFEDRYGGLVARRDFSPTEYLPGHPEQSGTLAANGLIEADLTLADPGVQVVSYEIDTCLPRLGAVGCGADDKGLHPE